MAGASPFLFAGSGASCALSQDVVSKAHKACKAVLRRKRASACLHEKIKAAALERRLPRLRGLRLARRARFNSYVMLLESFVLNASLVAEVIKDPVFQECFKASGDGERGPSPAMSARIVGAGFSNVSCVWAPVGRHVPRASDRTREAAGEAGLRDCVMVAHGRRWAPTQAQEARGRGHEGLRLQPTVLRAQRAWRVLVPMAQFGRNASGDDFASVWPA